MTRKRSIFCLSVAIACLALAWSAASESAETRKVAVLLSTGEPPFDQVLEGFRDSLRQGSAPLDIEILGDGRTPEDGGDFKLILALGSEALVQARTLYPDVPAVAGMILKKEDILAFPNTTGVFLEHPPETQLARMRQILPHVRRVGVVYSREENRHFIKGTQKVLARMGLQLVSQEVSGPRELPGALENLANTTDVLWGVSDQVVLTRMTARPILLFSFRNRIPFIGLSHAWTKAGALYSLDRDYRDLGRQCGEMAHRILRGERTDSIKPVAPRKVTYSVNLKTAQRMKIDISPSVPGAEEAY